MKIGYLHDFKTPPIKCLEIKREKKRPHLNGVGEVNTIRNKSNPSSTAW
jgi:hypothetical protein